MGATPLLIFDLIGTIGHFRKFYTNSSSLSYAFPTRTTVTGILAGILGLEKDSYYETFSLESCSIAISIRSPIRKLIQSVNYIQTEKTTENFIGFKGGTQIPIEWIVPIPESDLLRYRVYVTHSEKLEEISRAVEQPYYPPYLGLTECPGYIDLVGWLEPDDWQLISQGKPQDFVTLIPTDKINGALELSEDTQVLKEKIPLDFFANRRIKAVKDIIYECHGKSIKLSVNGECFNASYFDNLTQSVVSEWGTFLD